MQTINRLGINSLLNEWVEKCCFVKCIADEKYIHTQKDYRDFDFEKYFIGATCVLFEVTMLIERGLANNTLIIVITNQWWWHY